MENKQSIKKNYAYNLIYQLLIIIIPTITMPYLSRVIGANGVGRYSYSYSIAQYFVLFIMLGINNYGNRSIAAVNNDEKERKKTFSEIYTLQFLLGVVVCILYLLYIIFGAENKLILSITYIYVVSAIFDINWFFFRYGRI